MTEKTRSVQLLGQCRICVVCSKDLDQDTAMQVRIASSCVDMHSFSF